MVVWEGKNGLAVVSEDKGVVLVVASVVVVKDGSFVISAIREELSVSPSSGTPS